MSTGWALAGVAGGAGLTVGGVKLAGKARQNREYAIDFGDSARAQTLAADGLRASIDGDEARAAELLDQAEAIKPYAKSDALHFSAPEWGGPKRALHDAQMISLNDTYWSAKCATSMRRFAAGATLCLIPAAIVGAISANELLS